MGGGSGEMQKMQKHYEAEINRLKMQHMENMQAMKDEVDNIKAQNVVYQDDLAQH